MHPECGWHCPMGWGARLNEKERGESVDSSLCFLTAETMSPAASLPPACLPYHDRLHPLKPRAILPLSAFDRNVITVMRKMTSIPFSIVLGSTVLGGRFHISVPHLAQMAGHSSVPNTCLSMTERLLTPVINPPLNLACWTFWERSLG